MMRSKDNSLTLDQAYQATFLWLDHANDPPVDILEPSHGSVEIHTEISFVRVRFSDSPVEQSSVLALLRAALPGKRLLLFSPSGFSPGALSIAESQGISLFTLDSAGRGVPETTHARSITPGTEAQPPFELKSKQKKTDIFAQAPPPPKVTTDEAANTQVEVPVWTECSACETSHFGDVSFCKSCGKSMADLDAGKRSQMRCRGCGSHDIEVLDNQRD